LAALFTALFCSQNTNSRYVANLTPGSDNPNQSADPPPGSECEPTRRVLDLCASPGSKTTQLLEAININNGGGGGGAGVGAAPTVGLCTLNQVDP
jgi:hypothetical protein